MYKEAPVCYKEGEQIKGGGERCANNQDGTTHKYGPEMVVFGCHVDLLCKSSAVTYQRVGSFFSA